MLRNFPLTLNLSKDAARNDKNPSPSPRSPRFSPKVHTPTSPGYREGRYGRDANTSNNHTPLSSPSLNSFPEPVRTPTSTTNHNQNPSRSFFSHSKASKSSTRLPGPESSIRQVTDDQPHDIGRSNIYRFRMSPGSTPELSMASSPGAFSDMNGAGGVPLSMPLSIDASHDAELDQPLHVPETHPERKDSASQASESTPSINAEKEAPAPLAVGPTPGVIAHQQTYPAAEPVGGKRKEKHRFGKLSRSKSIRNDEEAGATGNKKGANNNLRVDSEEARRRRQELDKTSPRTAPIGMTDERRFREAISNANASSRNRSVDRGAAVVESEDETALPTVPRHGHKGQKSSFGNFKGEGPSKFLSGLKSQSSKAADGLNQAGKGFFGKFGRSGSTNEKHEVDLSLYQPKVIILPLIEQTRKTRISKRLADCRDKTEFWMPALPWRCIDYLNLKGIEEEGLYRVPGSGKDVKYWQHRFDTEHDINLFDETELYDINIIGSMFKAWLRDLPEKIFPKDIQAKIQRECPGATETPQMLKDELSKLPPFHYYLLFAITCHISLLHSYSEKNKMNYKNLTTCFQPSLDVDPPLFQWLILDWRNCWQGCWTEKEYLQEEYAWLAQQQQATAKLPPAAQQQPNGKTPGSSGHDRSLSSRSSAKGSALNGRSTPDGRQHRPMFRDVSAGRRSDRSTSRDPETGTLRRKPVPYSEGKSQSVDERDLRVVPQIAVPHIRNASDIPNLEPVEPVSPIEFSKNG